MREYIELMVYKISQKLMSFTINHLMSYIFICIQMHLKEKENRSVNRVEDEENKLLDYKIIGSDSTILKVKACQVQKKVF
jgi:hypothetical protein